MRIGGLSCAATGPARRAPANAVATINEVRRRITSTPVIELATYRRPAECRSREGRDPGSETGNSTARRPRRQFSAGEAALSLRPTLMRKMTELDLHPSTAGTGKLP